MGDPRSHLEKMGRELKCPICLSLLSSAVSLTCNHVFCNACILKSMKSGSNCPVCKVPYSRREVRAAPHMDNLVSVYKSMEAASGINIFVTQNEPSTKTSDKEMQVDLICGEQVIGGCQEKAEHQLTSKSKKLRRTSKLTVELAGPVSTKPSFPTKKRVQVAQYPLPETPTQPAKLEGAIVKNTSIELKGRSIIIKDNPISNREGAEFSPFFWLRDEDREKSSQFTEGDAYLTPPEIPSFSDLKNSDDIRSSELSPSAKLHGKSDGLDFFESEIFEWTQRACSPELLTSPVKTQVADTEENDEKKLEAALQGANTDVGLCDETDICANSEQGNGNVEEAHHKASCPINISPCNQIENGKLNKRGRKAKGTARKNCAKRDTDRGSGTPATSKEGSENFVQKRINDSNGKSFEKSSNRSKKVGRGTCATEPKSENVLPITVRNEIIFQHGKNIVSDSPTSMGKKQGRDEDLHFMKAGKKYWKITNQSEEDCCTKLKRLKVDLTEVNKLEKISMVQKETDEDTILHPSLISSSCMDADKKESVITEKPTKIARKINTAFNLKRNKESRCSKRMKASFSGISKDGLVEGNQVLEGCSNAAKETQSLEGVRGSTDVRCDSSKEKKLLKAQRGALRKCETLAHNIQCSFCHSSENSEASGEMVHYYNGRSVSADYDGGSKIIHSHRNCAEWAPNVYFENDAVINLEAELSRSRRIKCYCCGLNGAALGCYEKICRKSFHVPCAKLISQCQWDTDNFVMLCPLHASSKLPIENPGSQEIRKKCTSKAKLHTQCNQVAIKSDISTNSWHSLQTKLIICCSALTVGEKEIVFEFERLSKVTVLKKWDSSVTHVIASKDENGACKRTLKYLMGVLEGKWILNIDWVKACMKAMKPVDEEQYEINIDVHGIRDGPRLGRERVLNKKQKLFEGLNFYLMGGFESSYKGYLQDLLIAAGGTILRRKPISSDQEALLSASSTVTFIIYSHELLDKCDHSKKDMILNSRRFEAEGLAVSTGSKAVSNSWVLNSIAACKLQSFAE